MQLNDMNKDELEKLEKIETRLVEEKNIQQFLNLTKSMQS